MVISDKMKRTLAIALIGVALAGCKYQVSSRSSGAEADAGKKTIPQMGEEILDRVIQFASGEAKTKAETLAQNDFIPWKRGVSL